MVLRQCSKTCEEDRQLGCATKNPSIPKWLLLLLLLLKAARRAQCSRYSPYHIARVVAETMFETVAEGNLWKSPWNNELRKVRKQRRLNDQRCVQLQLVTLQEALCNAQQQVLSMEETL